RGVAVNPHHLVGNRLAGRHQPGEYVAPAAFTIETTGPPQLYPASHEPPLAKASGQAEPRATSHPSQKPRGRLSHEPRATSHPSQKARGRLSHEPPIPYPPSLTPCTTPAGLSTCSAARSITS